MSNKRQKARNRGKWFERLVAKWFKAERTPLSGSNSKITGADIIRPSLFVECKHYERMAVYSLWEKTRPLARKEGGKVPVLALGVNNKPGFLLVVHSDDWEEFAEIMEER